MNSGNDISDLIGRPYKDGGRGPDSFDCWGICLEAARRMQIEMPPLEVPEDNEKRESLIAGQKKNSFQRTDTARAGAVVLMRIIDDSSRVKWHVGLMIDNIHFIHTTQKMGVNISNILLNPWKLFIEGYYVKSDKPDVSDGSELWIV